MNVNTPTSATLNFILIAFENSEYATTNGANT
jgi:hypothetical protein